MEDSYNRNELRDIYGSFSPVLKLDPSLKVALDILEGLIGVLNNNICELLVINIDKNVEKLIRKHFLCGLTYIEDALKNPGSQNYNVYLHDARRSFIEAYNIETIPEQTRAAEYVAVCHELLMEYDLADTWYIKTYDILVSQHKQLMEVINDFEHNTLLSLYRIGKHMVKILLVIPLLVCKDDWEIHEDCLRKIYLIETQMKHLNDVFRKRCLKTNSNIDKYYFNPLVKSISRGSSMEHFERKYLAPLLIGYDEKGQPIQQIQLETGDETESCVSGKRDWGERRNY